MSDVFENAFQLDPASANDDPDSDGWTNLAESHTGTDPLIFSSALRLHPKVRPDDALEVGIDAVYGKLYCIEQSSDLVDWWPLDPALPQSPPGQDGTLIVEIPGPATSGPALFFRVSVTGEFDDDADGLSAWEERELGTIDNSANPLALDFDGDSVGDAEDRHPVNTLRWSDRAGIPGDTAAPAIVVLEPAGLVELN